MTGAPRDPYNPLAMKSIADSLVRELLKQPYGPLPPADRFNGAGVYVIYYRGPFAPYAVLSRRNAAECAMPIYVGKAEPAGARKGVNVADGAKSQALYGRLAEHAESINAATNLDLEDFSCRYRVIESLFIPLAERTLIEEFKPIWNSGLSGFGLHDPGSGRHGGRRSAWDEVHPGRSWYHKLQPSERTAMEWSERISEYLAQLEIGVASDILALDEEDDEADTGK